MPRPTPEAGQVLVRVAASAVNPLDIKIHAGEAPHALSRCRPFSALTSPVSSKRSVPMSRTFAVVTKSTA